MGLAKCIVPSCKDKTSRRLRIPHPIVDSYDRFWKWLALIQNPLMFKLDPMYVYKNKRICTRHFSPDRFVIGTKKLKRSALPDMNIGECHKVIKDKDGNVRDESLCLNSKDLSKDQCTLDDIEIGGNIDNPALEDNFELAATFSRETVISGEPISNNFRAWPSGEEIQCLISPSSQRLDNHQENIEDWNTDNESNEALTEDEADHDVPTHNDEDSPEGVSTCDESESTVCSNKGDIGTLQEILAGSCTKENSLVTFFAKAYQVASNFPQELQNQIMRDLLESLVRADSQHEKTLPLTPT